MNRSVAAALAGVVTAASFAVTMAVPALASVAAAAPGNPGTPSPGIPAFHEDFEDGLTDGQVTTITAYGGGIYTAEGAWALPSAQNGIILDPTSTDAAIVATGAPASVGNNVRPLAVALGALNGTGDQNHVVSAYTGGNPGANLIEFASIDPITLLPSYPRPTLEGRYLTFSVNVAAVNCGVSAPLLNFFLDDGTAELPINTSPINACAAGGSGTYIADQPVLWTEAVNPRMVMRNANGSGTGNDHAYDDIRLLDVTPQLDKEFVGFAFAGQETRLRFTVTNTEELGAKAGWSFTDNLPAGLTIAPTPDFSTTCTNGAITSGGAAGDTSVSLTGDLAGGTESCHVEIDVLVPGDAAVGDEYTNGPGNIASATGLDLPGPATLTISEPERLIGGCTNVILFDEDNSGWRVAGSVPASGTVSTGPSPALWVGDAGNPAGSIHTTDVDGNWTEFWSPDLTANGYTTDYSALAGTGEVVQFDFRTGYGYGHKVYMGIRGNNGDTVWFNFLPQVTPGSSVWNRIRVPMDDLSLWATTFDNSTGPVDSGAGHVPPTQAEFDAILSDVDRFVFSGETRTGTDLVWLDNFGQLCEDLGDLPDSYGTTGPEAASHTIVGYDEDAGTADLMLGSQVDHEATGQPGVDADGDDTNGIDDEDAVSAISVSPTEPSTATVVVTNNTDGPATLAGFIDLNGNGTFELSERATLIVPANSGTASYDLTFGSSALSGDANTYARFRLYPGEVTDPAPTGPVTGGEVEDYLVEQLSRLEIEKTAALVDTNGNGVADLGEIIDYSFNVANTGDTTLTDVVVNDARVPAAAESPVASLASGTAVDLGPFPYTVTEADILAGEVPNSATASGTRPGGGTVESEPDTTNTTTAPQDPQLEIDKQADLDDANDNGVADAGETIEYTFTVTNTGNVTITDISVVDPKVTGLSPSGFPLAPGASQLVTADPYTVTEADIVAGSVQNSATATGTPPGGGTVTSPPDTTTTVTPPVDPQLAIDKSADLDDANGNDAADPGETIEYTFTVTNTGNVTITDISVVDPKVTGLSPSGFTLAPGESQTVTADPYTVTETDIVAGSVHNSATATGTPPGGGTVTSPPDTTDTITVPANPALTIVKSAKLVDTNGNGLGDSGETIRYSFVVRNTGNVTITEVSVVDAKVTGLDPKVFTLAPGEQQEVVADPYVITADDARSGSVENIATARGTAPTDEVLISGESKTETKTVGPGKVPQKPLPNTGVASGAAAVLMGLMLILLGGAVLTIGRRRGWSRAS